MLRLLPVLILPLLLILMLRNLCTTTSFRLHAPLCFSTSLLILRFHSLIRRNGTIQIGLRNKTGNIKPQAMKKIGAPELGRGQMRRLPWRVSNLSLRLQEDLKNKTIIMISIHNQLIHIIKICLINLFLLQPMNSIQLQLHLLPGHQELIIWSPHLLLLAANNLLISQMGVQLTLLVMVVMEAT